MLKIGIWRPDQDTPAQRWWRRGSIAASILADDACAAPGRFERIMQQISLSNRVARTTFPGRFAALNESVQTCLESVFRPDQELVVEDWAVSSGTTAAEWFTRLKAGFPRVRFTASDAALYLVEARRGDDTYILQPDGTPIQYVRPPFVVSLVRKHNWLYPVNRLVQERALREWERIASQLEIPEWQDFSGPAVVKQPAFELRRLPLLHPAVLALRSEAFQIRRHSVFSALSAPVDVIRTMNILNRAYFSEAQLRDAVEAVERSLKPGGVWIVGRTVIEQPPQHEATVYRKLASGWEPLLRIGPGSEVEPLVQTTIHSSES
jgi:hypothetical protein